jgi:type I restriction enzyme, S subunit
VTGLPSGWASATLGELGIYVNGRGFKESEWSTRGRPIIRIQNLTGSSANFNYYSGAIKERHLVRPGDLLVSWAATLGAYVWRGPEAVLNQHIFRVKSFIDPGFHRYLIDYLLADILKQTHGSGMVHITKSRFDETPLALPPLGEQRRIVDALEAHLSRLDAGLAALSAADRRLLALRRSHLRSELRGSHTVCSISEVAVIANGQTAKGLREVAQPEPQTPDCLPFFKVGDMNYGDGRSLSTARSYLHPTTARRLGLKVWPSGTVVFPKRGGAIATNKKRILSSEGCFDLNTMGLVPGPRLSSNYLWYWLQQLDLSSIADGSNVPQINIPDVAPLRISLPSREEQDGIVTRLDEQMEACDRLKSTLISAKSQALRRALLVSTFSGRLVPQDPNDEPAELLLKRIRAERATEAPRTRRTRKAKATP